MLNAVDFITRRANLFDLLKNKDAKILVYGREALMRIPSVMYNFNQFSDLIYLSGYDRPGGALAIQMLDNKLHSTLFLPPRSKTEELWNGFRTPFEDAQELSGVDKVRPMAELEDWVAKYAGNGKDIYTSCPPHQKPHSSKFQQLAPYIDAVRWIKDKKEIEMIKKACEISRKAFSEIKAEAGKTEGHLAYKFQYLAAKYGGTGLAYPIVAASGKNALCLHYLDNNCVLKEGESIMMDAGAEYNHYASDFTRTMIIGKMSAAKSDVIEMVEDVKDALVAKAKRGQAFSIGHLHMQAEVMLQKGLVSLGYNVDIKAVRRQFPHGVSHWIGLDVHDADTVPYNAPLKPGCVFSVEPGLYFQMDDPNAPEELKGLGCRFEDTVILE